MILITIKNINNKLTDRVLIKETALTFENKYVYYVLYKRYNENNKDYFLWIHYKPTDIFEDELSTIWNNLKNLEELYFETFTLEETQKTSFVEILNAIANEEYQPEASKIEYREYKFFNKNSKTWIKK
jgi:hypothetical protein